MTRSIMLTTITAATALAAGTASADLITNGGFEPTGNQNPGGYQEITGGGDTTISGWTTIPTGVEWFLPSQSGFSNSPNGGYAVDMANFVYSPGGIEQAVATTPNATYQVSFYFATVFGYAGRTGNSDITVTAGSSVHPISISTTSTDLDWTLQTFTFVADSASTTVTFQWQGNPYEQFAIIDGVSVTAVPLPTAGLAGLGMLSVLGLVRSRRNSAL